MKGNELRIGNYTDKGQVKSFYEHGIHVGMGKCYKFCDLKPIPLTEDILFKCGFSNKKNILAGHEYSKGLIYRITKQGAYIAFRIYSVLNNNTMFIRNISYLHELQNLYFAITGEELEVKL